MFIFGIIYIYEVYKLRLRYCDCEQETLRKENKKIRLTRICNISNSTSTSSQKNEEAKQVNILLLKTQVVLFRVQCNSTYTRFLSDSFSFLSPLFFSFLFFILQLERKRKNKIEINHIMPLRPKRFVCLHVAHFRSISLLLCSLLPYTIPYHTIACYRRR